MSTFNLTGSNLSEDFVIATDGDIQVLISNDSAFEGASFHLEYETDVGGVFIPVPATSTRDAYSRIYTFKAGNLRLQLAGNPTAETNVVVDVK